MGSMLEKEFRTTKGCHMTILSSVVWQQYTTLKDKQGANGIKLKESAAHTESDETSNSLQIA